jgi:hypothetical protein
MVWTLLLRHSKNSDDAGKFSDLDRFTHFYMFNPFPCPVVREVLENLAASLARRPRRVTWIYHLPACDDVIMDSGLFRREMKLDFPDSHPFFVYVHDSRKCESAASA